MKTFTKDRLTVEIHGSRNEMGAAAATDIAAHIVGLLKKQDKVRMIFAAAPSQNEVLASLVADNTVDWTRVEAFHMDEYQGLDVDAPQGFGNFLRDRIFKKLPFMDVHYICGQKEAEKACEEYAALLSKAPIDIVCMGVGENGHIAFNDPPADFNDKALVKPVKLDEVCRQQQVNDGCFATIDDVPTTALTLTVPALFGAGALFCVVPAATKANAVQIMLNQPISESCPASILRCHDCAKLYLEPDSAAKL